MKIFINGEGVELDDGAAIVNVVEHVTNEREPAGVAVALNGQVVRRAEWATTSVAADDRIEVLRATAGG